GYDFEAALSHLAAYREHHPEDIDALVGIARCYREMSRPQDAKMLLEDALRRKPDHSMALLTLALVASDLEDDELAWRLLERLEPQVERRDNMESPMLVQRGELPPPHALGTRQEATVYHQAARVLRRLGREDAARDYDRKLERLTKEQLRRDGEES